MGLAGAALTVGLSGCQIFSPVQTSLPYQASDGVPVDLGEVQIHDLVVVSAAKGSPGNVVGQVVNTSGSAQTILFADGGSAKASAQVPPHTTERLAGGKQVILPSMPVPPGAVISLQVATQASGVHIVQVPVLGPDLYYKTLAPSATPSAPPSGQATHGPPPTK